MLPPDAISARLERRLGRVHARQRLGIEADHERQLVGQGLNLFHIENWYPAHALLSLSLRIAGVYGIGQRNAERIALRHNIVRSSRLPRQFDGMTVLHISDTHVEMCERPMRRVCEMLNGLRYDICVLTGDYRAKTFGSVEGTIAGMAELRRCIAAPTYAVLGNHDSIRMVPDLEDMDIRVLLNEAVTIDRGADRIFIAGVDDAHFYRVDNLEKAAEAIPEDAFSILLSHTPEIYRQAAHSGFSLMLSGHTHGGQICLPGSIPITLDSKLPRKYGRGAWRYGAMAGYTSVGAGSCIVPVRFNCPPEVTLHRLQCED